MVAALWLRTRSNASLFWRWFKYWRKRYMWLRVAILVVLFAEPVHNAVRPLIRDLVIIAIKGIESAKLGPRLQARAYEFHERKRLQNALRAAFDTNGDGLLSRAEAGKLTAATGLAAGEVTGSGLDVELEPLVEASHKTGVLSRVVTATDIHREALGRAMQEQEAEHVALWREVEPMLDATRNDPAEWLRWATWKSGAQRFAGTLQYRLVEIVPGVGNRFLSIQPGLPEEMRPPRWRRYLLLLFVLAIVAIAVCRFGRAEELRRRFDEDPELALARCPICKTPTKDYGVLRQHRGPRAWATGAVIFLAVFTAATLARTAAAAGGEQYGSGPVDPALVSALVLAIAAGCARWLLWPREIHACHRRPHLLVLGFAGATLLVAVVGVLVVGFGLQLIGVPNRPVMRARGLRFGGQPGRRSAAARQEPRAPLGGGEEGTAGVELMAEGSARGRGRGGAEVRRARSARAGAQVRRGRGARPGARGRRAGRGRPPGDESARGSLRR
jgi:hypothetical protein